jgi:Pvc16 N-terminal domain
MANWRVVENTGMTLVGLLQRHITGLGIPGVRVDLVTPAAFPSLADTTVPFVSLFLFQIAGNAEMRNAPRTLRPDGSYQRQPLPLELCYLVTAWGVRATDDVAGDLPATRDEARLLGAVMQAFYDNAELDRGGLFEEPTIPVWSPMDGLQIVMETLPLEGHYRIWDAAELGYHLSLVYRVRVAGLEPAVIPPAPPVTEAALETV